MELRPGEGGADAEAFATELADAVTSFARRRGLGVERRGGQAGRTLVLVLSGRLEGLELERFSGTHRVQRIPKGERSGRRHTSTATIAVVNAADVVVPEVHDRDLRIDTYRGSGKGGQHRNKTDSAVRLTHLPSGLVVCSQDQRQQGQNLAKAKAVLAERLAERAAEAAGVSTNRARVAQVGTGERSAKQWTWNTQRSEVLEHTTGRKYPLGRLVNGHLEDVLVGSDSEGA